MPCGLKHPEKDLTCFLPEGHKFVAHIARDEPGGIHEWGEAKEQPKVHDHADGFCEMLGHRTPKD